MVRLRIAYETYPLNRLMPQQQSLADTVHPVHHPSIGRKNHRVRKIAFLYQARMLHHGAASHLPLALAAPVGLIQLANLRQGNPFHCEKAR